MVVLVAAVVVVVVSWLVVFPYGDGDGGCVFVFVGLMRDVL